MARFHYFRGGQVIRGQVLKFGQTDTRLNSGRGLARFTFGTLHTENHKRQLGAEVESGNRTFSVFCAIQLGCD